MRAILEFELPEDQEDFELATNAPKWAMACSEFAAILRRMTKYGEDVDSEGRVDIEKLRQKFYDCLNEAGVSV